MPSEYKNDCGSNEVQQVVPPPMREEIEVEFSEKAHSGVEEWNFNDDTEAQGKRPSDLWSEAVTRILETNEFVSWKPSFPLRYPWSPECSTEEARAAYEKAGRDKFITVKFAPEDKVRVLSIAQQLRELPEIARVAAVPEIAPPHITNAPRAMSNPLAEPLTGESDQVVINCSPTVCLTNQWYLFRCCIPEAWNMSASGHGVVIADIDWGFDLTHPDLEHTELSQSMITESINVADGNLLFHGNGVLGLVGAAVNGQGMAGIAYDASLWAIQAGTGAINSPVVEPEFWVKAINFVVNTPAKGRKIIILELQTKGYSNAESILSINLEIVEAIKAGVIVCVPAGNDSESRDAGLGDDDIAIKDTGSIVVGATRFDAKKNIRSGSNGGARVTVYAPGDSESDLTCGLRGSYRNNFGGTSGATAKVAGVVALMLEKNNRLTPEEVRTILHGLRIRAVDDDDNDVGAFLDAGHAVGAAIAARGTTLTGGTAPGPLPARMERAA